ncbi:hypothetical protein [Mucilaginibacter sp. BT774]|uniref:hypothetical protein n=1 Tax=Mucilaginibacter sp. BT774 TaxID=3062276 RepID=UPI00267676DE|nr:hypothetical protein [Mucilaginibacter sp. BT774]MDO3627213.1 hypothetical protein [Mucilaginibacter sp. BT774]
MKYICALLLLTIYMAVNATPTNRILIDRPARIVADSDTLVKKRSVSAGVSYGSDASFFGRTGPVKYPFLNADVIYNTKNGWFVYGSAYKVLGSTPTIDEIDLGGGYVYHITPKFSGNISYTRFIFDRNALIIKSASSNDINFNNSYDWKILKSGVVLDYLFGESHDFFITITNSKYIETNWSIFDDKDYLSFNPGVNIILGTQNFVQKYNTNHPGRVGLGYDDDLLMPPLIAQKYAGHNSELDMLNYSFKIPIAYNRPHYTFEFAYKYSIPVNVEGILRNHKESFFNLTFYYVFY